MNAVCPPDIIGLILLQHLILFLLLFNKCLEQDVLARVHCVNIQLTITMYFELFYIYILHFVRSFCINIVIITIIIIVTCYIGY